MTQNINPSKINPYIKKYRADRKNARRRKLRSLDPQKYLTAAREALNNEVAWVRSLFYSIRRRSFKNDKTRQRKIALGHYDCHVTLEEFLELWAAHKKRYGGMCCGYTGVLMTHQRSAMTDPLRNQSHNISVDRIDPEKPYTKENIIFCTVKFNNLKGSITYNDCLLILQKFIELGKR